MKGMTGSELMMMEFEPQNFIVEGLMPEGLNILAGNKGHGKSFLALDLAIAVNEGGLLWNAFQATKGAVLFLAFEDTMPRLKRRLAMRGTISPGNIEFYTDWKPLQDGGLEDMGDWIALNTTAKLIVLDTLGRIAPISGNYDTTTHTFGELSKFAHRHRVAIVACHHMVKKGSTDPFLDIQGSTGIGGAADTLLVLKRRRFNTDATLGITGKDVEETELAIRFDRNRGTWSVVGTASDLCVSDERQVLHDIIANHGQPMSLEDIQAALEKKGIVKEPGTIRVLLTRMVDAGEVSREGRGRYVVEREKLPMLPSLPIHDEVSETTSNNGNNGNEGPASKCEPPAGTISEPNTPLSLITSTTPVAHGDSTVATHLEAATGSPQKVEQSDAIPATVAQPPSAPTVSSSPLPNAVPSIMAQATPRPSTPPTPPATIKDENQSVTPVAVVNSKLILPLATNASAIVAPPPPVTEMSTAAMRDRISTLDKIIFSTTGDERVNAIAEENRLRSILCPMQSEMAETILSWTMRNSVTTRVEIKVFQWSDGLWSAHSDVQIHTAGIGGLYCGLLVTKEDAINHAVSLVRDWVERQADRLVTKSSQRQLNAIRRAVNEFMTSKGVKQNVGDPTRDASPTTRAVKEPVVETILAERIEQLK